ncbi:hypothetical protein [Anaeromyxobacter sp. PSR-1]|uniref:hypothetical protein n=1 Tax=Anaeromyxobacter sp. PSR-1 TaxID=1300915 RepID=UPI0013649AD4|nr:hypothetical protein [Anaeromyxobacter sp. PSR-1]
MNNITVKHTWEKLQENWRQGVPMLWRCGLCKEAGITEPFQKVNMRPHVCNHQK